VPGRVNPSSLPQRRPLAARALARFDIDYGVWIIVGSLLLMFVGVGVGYYALAIFARELETSLGWSSTLVGSATGMYFTLSGLTAWLVGPHIDRHGPLRVMTFGVVALGIGVSFVGAVARPWHLFVVYGVMAVGFGCAASVGVNAILSRWFVTRRARAMSVTFTGTSLGGVVLAPLVTWLAASGGLGRAGMITGLLVLAVGLPVTVFVLVWDPAQVGAEVDHGRPLDVDNANLADRVQKREWTRNEAMRTVPFWAILVAFVLILTAQTGFLIQQFSFLSERFGDERTASFTLSVTAMGSVVARLVAGQFADAIDKRIFTVSLFVVQATAVLAIALVDNRAATWLLVLVIGFTVGNVYMMQTLLVSEIFGMVSLGAVMGAVSLATQTASGLGPFGVGWLRDGTDGFTIPFVVTAAMSYVAAVVVLAAKPVEPENEYPAVGESALLQ
jgi:MFS family permease